MARARGSALLSKKRKYSAATSVNCFDFSGNDDDFKELAKGFWPNNTKLSNSWALKIYSEWVRCIWMSQTGGSRYRIAGREPTPAGRLVWPAEQKTSGCGN